MDETLSLLDELILKRKELTEHFKKLDADIQYKMNVFIKDILKTDIFSLNASTEGTYFQIVIKHYKPSLFLKRKEIIKNILAKLPNSQVSLFNSIGIYVHLEYADYDILAELVSELEKKLDD